MSSSGAGWGAVDWVANWQQIVEDRRQRVEALGEGNRAGGDFWDRRADQCPPQERAKPAHARQDAERAEG